MNKHKHRLTWATLALAATVSAASPAAAQVAGGSTTVGISVIESTQIATGWSVKKTLLGKTIYNETGQKIGKVADLIISPDKKVSYVIVGAGGFIGIGRAGACHVAFGHVHMAGGAGTAAAAQRQQFGNAGILDDFHHAHAAAVPVQHFSSRLLQDFRGERGGARRKIERPCHGE